MTKNIYRLAILFLFATFLPGCSSTGEKFSAQDAWSKAPKEDKKEASFEKPTTFHAANYRFGR